MCTLSRACLFRIQTLDTMNTLQKSQLYVQFDQRIVGNRVVRSEGNSHLQLAIFSFFYTPNLCHIYEYFYVASGVTVRIPTCAFFKLVCALPTNLNMLPTLNIPEMPQLAQICEKLRL